MKKILIVDDVTTDIKLVEEILHKEGFSTSSTTLGKEALNKAKNERPDLVLLDIVMGDINGFDVCRDLLADPATKSIPIIFVSSKNQKVDIMWARSQGAKDYVTKPFTADELLKAVKNIIG